jgi:hypothetical protein
MTPAEINGRIEAYSANRQRQIENMDALAWMQGAYNARGYHEPKKYPNKPEMAKNKINLPEEPEDEELMKDKLITFAGIHNTIEGVR